MPIGRRRALRPSRPRAAATPALRRARRTRPKLGADNVVEAEAAAEADQRPQLLTMTKLIGSASCAADHTLIAYIAEPSPSKAIDLLAGPPRMPTARKAGLAAGAGVECVALEDRQETVHRPRVDGASSTMMLPRGRKAASRFISQASVSGSDGRAAGRIHGWAWSRLRLRAQCRPAALPGCRRRGADRRGGGRGGIVDQLEQVGAVGEVRPEAPRHDR